MLRRECVVTLGRLVLDKQTRKPKGTAFVEFEAPAAAQKAAAACAKARCAPCVSPKITMSQKSTLPLDAAMELLMWVGIHVLLASLDMQQYCLEELCLTFNVYLAEPVLASSVRVMLTAWLCATGSVGRV